MYARQTDDVDLDICLCMKGKKHIVVYILSSFIG